MVFFITGLICVRNCHFVIYNQDSPYFCRWHLTNYRMMPCHRFLVPERKSSSSVLTLLETGDATTLASLTPFLFRRLQEEFSRRTRTSISTSNALEAFKILPSKPPPGSSSGPICQVMTEYKSGVCRGLSVHLSTKSLRPAAR